MDYVRLGASGLQVSRVCLGMMSYGDRTWRAWTLDRAEAAPIVRRAAEKGITFYETADVYSDGASEKITGSLLREIFPCRQDYVLATKVNSPTGPGPNDRGLSRKHILAAVDASLRRLGTDYVDLYQIHRWDPETPIEETMRALHDVVRSGKARYIGASSMYAWQFAKAQHTADLHGWTRFVSMSDHYNLLYREEEREMIPYCLDQGIGVIPWSPLARGLLTRAPQATPAARTARAGSDPLHDPLYGDANTTIVERVQAVAGARAVPAAQIALAWLMNRPGVTAPIIGATRPEHIDDAVHATRIRLAADETRLLEEPYRPRPILGHE